ncbi:MULTISPECIES: hypothetical protein [unclassified Undibacterium]|uniref:hypothetical protein n=1 Tax=unclassified Undibacterium TaxID=2630295 RepID=UPI002AC947A4|nr:MULTISPECIES: hypothetical protein [unclassified Undibacterium]MEB0140694.1 hypothetical protein [Undibacterium sp. CCC2.1]MEB0173690.1 hypothetical protein [Undibacterium sp. CCC1.1]MEB0177678.1 hypothetical protein [Undibacterium sp. CCC3.4]MEB0216857.1 hypothetical protein [Undibacterium sp. 5I2]WPX43356.1 hypothetical protein RHM61_18560 [Undibacterium sp. CCC3.4]
MEKRQRQTDTVRGRGPDDDTPMGADNNPKRESPFKSKFGEPKPKAQDSFTDTGSRIMKHSGGNFNYSYNGQTAFNGTAHIIGAAELGNNTNDYGQLPAVLAAVKRDVGTDPI